MWGKLSQLHNLMNNISISNETYILIKIMLKKRKESDTYLAADRRHCQSVQIAMKVDKVCSFQPALRPLSAEEEDSSADEGCSAG